MGDCVMAFWGVLCRPGLSRPALYACGFGHGPAVEQLNQEHRAQGLPEIGVGIGLNTGLMCVGDMVKFV